MGFFFFLGDKYTKRISKEMTTADSLAKNKNKNISDTSTATFIRGAETFSEIVQEETKIRNV